MSITDSKGTPAIYTIMMERGGFGWTVNRVTYEPLIHRANTRDITVKQANEQAKNTRKTRISALNGDGQSRHARRELILGSGGKTVCTDS